MGSKTKLDLAGINRAEPPPNPNGGYGEELIAVGTSRHATRFVAPDNHPLALARKGKRISEMQFQAGHKYREKSSFLDRSGKDSTLQLLVSGGGSPTTLTDAQCDASAWLVRVNWLMAAQHRHIVQQVCGYGETPARAVKMILPREAKNVTSLFQQALDGLGEAILKAAKIGNALPLDAFRKSA